MKVRRLTTTYGVVLGDSVYLAVAPEPDLNLETTYLLVVDRSAVVDLAHTDPPVVIALAPAATPVIPEEPAGDWFRRTMSGP